MAGFLARRTGGLLLTLLVLSLIVFLTLEFLPGDVAQYLLGTEVREDTLAALRAAFGLDRPAWDRYLSWLGGLLTGDLGTSRVYAVSVAKLIGDRVVVSLPLAGMAFLIAMALAFPLGLIAASRRGQAGDYAVMGFSQIGLAMPNFWLGLLLILAFAVALPWARAGGFPGWGNGVGPALGALVLPAITLALGEAAILARVLRAALLETLSEDYVRTARAKGLSGRAILFGHALRNAMMPVLTVMGLQLGYLIAGAVVVETVFTLPGLGQLLVQSIFQRDFAVTKTLVMLFAGFVVFINAAVDVAYRLADPRAGRG